MTETQPTNSVTTPKTSNQSVAVAIRWHSLFTQCSLHQSITPIGVNQGQVSLPSLRGR